jgi:hypothetical protein
VPGLHEAFQKHLPAGFILLFMRGILLDIVKIYIYQEKTMRLSRFLAPLTSMWDE